jgi:hypothetical protein
VLLVLQVFKEQPDRKEQQGQVQQEQMVYQAPTALQVFKVLLGLLALEQPEQQELDLQVLLEIKENQVQLVQALPVLVGLLVQQVLPVH